MQKIFLSMFLSFIANYPFISLLRAFSEYSTSDKKEKFISYFKKEFLSIYNFIESILIAIAVFSGILIGKYFV